MPVALKIAVAVSIILGTSWLAGKLPELAGFLTALPLVSILALAFSYTDHQNLALSARYARSIIIAVPVSWLFFLPFFFAERLHLSFWQTWGLGLLLLAGGYFLHQAITR
jgi:hypothetical protein